MQFQEIFFSLFLAIPLLVIALGVIAWCIESDRIFNGTILFIGACVYTGFAVEWSFIQTLLSNIPAFLGGLSIYLVIGICWAFFKWYLVIEDKIAGLKLAIFNFKQTREYTQSNDPKNLYSDCLPALAKYLKKVNILSFTHEVDALVENNWTTEEIAIYVAPKASDNKAKITAWIAYFPISILWTLLHDAVKRLFNKIYTMISKSFQTLSDTLTKRAFK